MVLAFTVVVSLSGSSLARGLAMATVGYLLSLVGLGAATAEPRFVFGFEPLMSGIDLIPLVVGLFAISEVFLGLEEARVAIAQKIRDVFPRVDDLRRAMPAILRGTGIGFLLGLLPGCAPGVTVFLAYDVEKKLAREPDRFGRGAIEGVAAPEAANNATSSAGFIPLLALGIPASAPLAILLGGLMVYGLQPGPLLFQKNAEFVWTIVASLYVGNVILLVLNLPLVGMWVWLTRVPFGILGPAILLLSFVGAYSVRNSMLDVAVSLVFGILGYFLRKFQWPQAPLLLAYILGPLVENNLLQSLSMSGGSPLIFVQRGLSLALIVSAAILLVTSLVLIRYASRRVRETTAEELAL
jgi:putative tricarboxylic transport membrane protein